MKVYLVGGAIRDKILNIEFQDQDWVVVGSNTAEMKKLGYKSVGKDFPVFLHPKTNEEYALARTETKTKPGYHGFSFNTSEEITLIDDLKRRDLTINAIAQDKSGKIIDPFNGQKDIKDKILRHVSPSFKEDPIRVLRVAKFAARLHSYGFKIAPTTITYMKQMVNNNEIDTLVRDRVWAETLNALSNQNSHIYFITLNKIGALNKIYPNFNNTSDLDKLRDLFNNLPKNNSLSQLKFALLLNHMFKQHNIKQKLELISNFCANFPVSKLWKELTILLAQNIQIVRNYKRENKKQILDIFYSCDAFRRKNRFYHFLDLVMAYENSENNSTTIKKYDFLRQQLEKLLKLDFKLIKKQNPGIINVAELLYSKRLTMLK